MKIINCTPHAINLFVGDEERMVIDPSGLCPRCSQSEEIIGEILGIPVTKQTFGSVEGLPDPEEGVFLVVSRMVALAATDREDLLVPGPMVRDPETGRPKGCNGLSRV